MVEKRTLPEFKSEAEEAAWWFDHQDEILDDFVAADAEGRLKNVTALIYSAPEANVIHLKPKAIALAREQAAKRNVAYERYVEDLLDQALLREAKAS